MTMRQTPPATSIVGEYELLDALGKGSAGTVYKARRRDSGDLVEVKVLPAQTADQDVLMRRFQQVFRAASRLNHPNIVRALDFHDAGKQPFLVMEYVEGESLGEKVERDGALPEAEALRI